MPVVAVSSSLEEHGRAMDLTETFGLLPFTRATWWSGGSTTGSGWRSGEVVRLRRGVYVTALGTDDRTRYAQRIAAQLITQNRPLRRGHVRHVPARTANPTFTSWDRLSRSRSVDSRHDPPIHPDAASLRPSPPPGVPALTWSTQP